MKLIGWQLPDYEQFLESGKSREDRNYHPRVVGIDVGESIKECVKEAAQLVVIQK